MSMLNIGIGIAWALRRTTASLALAVALTLVATASASGQTLTVLHNFTGSGDGSSPQSGFALDAAGNLYGTASSGGSACNCGTVFKLMRRGSAWTLTPIYTFQGGTDGRLPLANVIFGPNGTLYGTTDAGGRGDCSPDLGCGTVFNLQPSPTVPSSLIVPWKETVLYRFAGGVDGENPGAANLVFDTAGNLYGTTQTGGTSNAGIVYQLTHTNGGWTKTSIVNFAGGRDGANPRSGVIFDHAGNLYGTTSAGGANAAGTVFQLSRSGSGWTKTVLHDLGSGSDGAIPVGGLLMDGAGNLYGTTTSGGDGAVGVIFELTPSNGSWTYAVIHSFLRPDASQPVDTLIMDAAGSLYGTALNGGTNNLGAVFKLAPSNGSWIFESLRSFSGADGAAPFGNLAIDHSGNIFGTTSAGGNNLMGVAFEVSP